MKSIKNQIAELEIKISSNQLENKIKTASKYQVISPDGFRIDMADAALKHLK
jgi:hypothetical protein